MYMSSPLPPPLKFLQRAWALTKQAPVSKEDKEAEQRHGPLLTAANLSVPLLQCGLEALDTVVVSDSRPEGERKAYGLTSHKLRAKPGLQAGSG